MIEIPFGSNAARRHGLQSTPAAGLALAAALLLAGCVCPDESRPGTTLPATTIKQFIGAYGDDWSDPRNWSGGTLPADGDPVRIAARVRVAAGTTAKGKAIDVREHGELRLDGGVLATTQMKIGRGAVLAGAGRIERAGPDPLQVRLEGLLRPDGLLDLRGNVQQTARGVLRFELGATPAPRVDVEGVATLEGTLQIDAAAGALPAGTTADVIVAGGLTGAFGLVHLRAAGDDVRIAAQVRPDGGRAHLEISATAPPPAAAFGTPVTIAFDGTPTAVGTGDLDGDGDADVLVGVDVGGAPQMLLFRNDGGGTFAAPVGVALPEPAMQVIVTRLDANDPLSAEAIIGTAAGVLRIDTADDTSPLDAPQQLAQVASATALAVGDFAGNDDALDLLVGEGAGNMIEVFTNDGANVFSATDSIRMDDTPGVLEPEDVDVDKRVATVGLGNGDLAIIGWDGSKLDVVATVENVGSDAVNAVASVPLDDDPAAELAYGRASGMVGVLRTTANGLAGPFGFPHGASVSGIRARRSAAGARPDLLVLSDDANGTRTAAFVRNDGVSGSALVLATRPALATTIPHLLLGAVDRLNGDDRDDLVLVGTNDATPAQGVLEILLASP